NVTVSIPNARTRGASSASGGHTKTGSSGARVRCHSPSTFHSATCPPPHTVLCSTKSTRIKNFFLFVRASRAQYVPIQLLELRAKLCDAVALFHERAPRVAQTLRERAVIQHARDVFRKRRVVLRHQEVLAVARAQTLRARRRCHNRFCHRHRVQQFVFHARSAAQRADKHGGLPHKRAHIVHQTGHGGQR